jgi:hypothetical protein
MTKQEFFNKTGHYTEQGAHIPAITSHKASHTLDISLIALSVIFVHIACYTVLITLLTGG